MDTVEGDKINMDTKTEQLETLGRIRNRQVAKLLTYIGDVPPFMEDAIKRHFTFFSEDVATDILHCEPHGQNGHEKRTKQDIRR